MESSIKNNITITKLFFILLTVMVSTSFEGLNAQTTNMKETTYPKDWRWKSPYTVKETMDRLLSVIDQHPEVYQYSRIDQKDIARLAGKEIRPVECAYFQNTTLVGKILEANIEAAEQLPIKSTIWEDETGQVWIQTTNADIMDGVYKLNGADGAIDAIRKLLPQWINQALTS